jgi:hypothetical protein
MPLETSLKEVPRAMVPAVEVARVAAVEKLHARRQIGLGSLHKEVLVVRHERERVHAPPVGLDGPTKPVRPFCPVFVVSDHRAAFVAPGNRVLQGTRKLDP